jgi:hypothetical protein
MNGPEAGLRFSIIISFHTEEMKVRLVISVRALNDLLQCPSYESCLLSMVRPYFELISQANHTVTDT